MSHECTRMYMNVKMIERIRIIYKRMYVLFDFIFESICIFLFFTTDVLNDLLAF